MLSLITSIAMMMPSLRNEPVAQARYTHGFRSLLFVGNSWTHGHFNPVRTYNGAALTKPFISANTMPRQAIANRHTLDLNAIQPADSPRSEYAKSGQAGPWGGIPGIIQHFAGSLRLNWQTYIMAVSGKSLVYHTVYAPNILTHGEFTDVIAQDQLAAGVNGALYDDVATLQHLVNSGDAATRIYLDAPPLPPELHEHNVVRADREFRKTAAQLAFGTQGVAEVGYAFRVAQRLGIASRTYPTLTKTRQNDQHLIRTGDAPDPNHAADGKIQLYGQDLYHPSSAGAYLSALVQFSTLSHIDPRAIGTRDDSARALGLSDTDSMQLQSVAAEALAQKGFILTQAP